MTVLESVVKDLENLPLPKLMEVARYVSGLLPKGRDHQLAAIRATAGCMAGDEGAAFERLVRQEADRIDPYGAE